MIVIFKIFLAYSTNVFAFFFKMFFLFVGYQSFILTKFIKTITARSITSKIHGSLFKLSCNMKA